MSEQTDLQPPEPPQPIAPVKPPTLASVIIQVMTGIESSLDLLVVRIERANGRARLSVGIATLSVLLNIATLVLVAYLLGHVR